MLHTKPAFFLTKKASLAGGKQN